MMTALVFLKSQPRVERVLVSDEFFARVASLRYRVYVEEKGFLEKGKYRDERETDEYDGTSIHIVVLIGKRLAGYARVILPTDKSLPIFNHFELPEEDIDHACEVSRFMIASTYRRKQEARREIFRLLAQEIMLVVEENGIKNVYAVVEDWLLKSLLKRGYNFEVIGPPDSSYMNTTNFPVLLRV